MHSTLFHGGCDCDFYVLAVECIQSFRVVRCQVVSKFFHGIDGFRIDSTGRRGTCAICFNLSRRVNAGQRSEIDLIYCQTKARYDAAWREISAVACVQEMTPTILAGEFPESSDAMSWDNIATTIVGSSPEYAAAQARISQARAELQRHGVQAIPNMTVQFGAGVDNGTNSGIMNLQVGAPIPVFNKNQGNIAAARAEYCRTVMESQRIENAIRARLATVSRDFESALEAVTVYGRDIRPSAQEALALSETAYKAGEMNFIQLLVARQTYFESNLQYVNSQAQMASAKAKVDGFVLSGSLDAVMDRSGSDSLRGLTFNQQ